MIRRLGAIGDIHCEDELLARVLHHFEHAALDAVVSVGDIVDGYGDADRCCALLRASGVLAVRGNHERWLLADTMRSLPDATLEVDRASRSFLESLPVTRALETCAGALLLCHGVGDDDMARLGPDTRGYDLQGMPELRRLMLADDVAYVVGGHSHQPMVRAFPGLVFLNPGTLHREWEPSCMIVDFEARTVELYRVDDARLELASHEPLPDPAPIDPAPRMG